MSGLRLLALAAALATGCASDSNQISVIYTEPEVAWSLFVTLERGAVDAGETQAYGLVMVSENGDTVPVEGELRSNLEADLSYDESTLTPIVAGEHTLTGTAEFEGEAYLGGITLTVFPGPLHTYDLALSDLQVHAGEYLPYTLTAEDLYGNAVDVTDSMVDIDSAEVTRTGTVDAGELVSTKPGIYTMTTWLTDSQDGSVLGTDSETWAVVPGDPTSVTLTLSETELELFETTRAIIDIVDDYGNEVDAPWTLSVDGAGETSLAYTYLTFWEEGEYTVRVDVDDTELWDEVGPILIDSSGPTIEVDTPERGDWSTDATGEVSGTVTDDWSDIVSFTVNGDSVSVESDGSFSSTVDYDFGLNILETSAEDADGNVATDTRSVLHGDFVPYGEPIDDGVVVRIHEGDGGLGELEEMGEGLIDETDLDALIPNPVVDEESESCVDLWVTEICVTWYALYLTVDNPYIGSTDLSIDPQSTGVIDTQFTIYDPSIDWDADATLLEVDFTTSGTISADSISVSMDLTPSVSSNVLLVDVSNVAASSSGFDFDWNSWIDDVLDFFGISLDSIIQGYLEDAIEDAVEDEVPELLEDALNDLEISTDMEFGDRAYTLDALPSSVSVDDLGITLGMQTEVSVDAWTHSEVGEGSLFYGYSVPTWTGSPATAMGANLDFLNQFLYVLWGGGMLDMELAGEELGLDIDELDLFLGDTGQLSIVTEALLPPVAVPGTGSDMLDLQVGDLLLTIYAGDQIEGNEVIQVYVSLIAGLDMDSDGEYLLANLGDMDLWFDVVVPDASSPGAHSTEALLEALLPLLLPSLTDAVSEIPIPDIDGFGIENTSVDLVGSDDGFIEIGGELALDL